MAEESTSGTRVWVVAESSAGFGRARAALERGELVVATARKPEQHEDFDDLSTTNQPPKVSIARALIDASIACHGRVGSETPSSS
jgi:hypothetical protein